jgi:hypothetical protein
MADFSFQPGELDLMRRAWDQPIPELLKIDRVEVERATNGDTFVRVLYGDRRLECFTLEEAHARGIISADWAKAYGWRAQLDNNGRLTPRGYKASPY